MKPEFIKEAYKKVMAIERLEKSLQELEKVTKLALQTTGSYPVAYVDLDKPRLAFNTSDNLMAGEMEAPEELVEEFIKSIQRVKHRINERIYNLKKEVEDLK